MKNGFFVFKKIFLSFIIISIFIAIYTYYHQGSGYASRQPRQDQPLKVKVATIKPQTIYDEIEALGTVFANEAVNITSTDTDKISEIRFDDGQAVKKDEIIILLRQDEEQAQKKAEAAQVLEHERELQRLEDLLKRNAAAKTEYDTRKTQLLIAQHRIAETQARIEDKTIRAPFDGILGLRKISVGALVEPGTIITTLDDISQIKLDFSVPSIYLDVVKENLEIKAEAEAFPDQVFKGKVTKISPRVDSITRTVEVRALLPNPNRLIKPGLLLTVRLLRNQRQALMVPEESTIQLQSSHYVLVVTDNLTVERKQIEIGKRQPGWVEVLSGVQEGDKVITRGISRVKPGATVAIDETISNLPNHNPQVN